MQWLGVGSSTPWNTWSSNLELEGISLHLLHLVHLAGSASLRELSAGSRLVQWHMRDICPG